MESGIYVYNGRLCDSAKEKSMNNEMSNEIKGYSPTVYYKAH